MVRRMRRRRHIDDGARFEGLAAGTGLLTGDAARRAVPTPVQRACARCQAPAEIELLDLVDQRTSWHCESCGYKWEESTASR
jgi:hypothetical protein